MGLREVLEAYISHRKKMITNRTNFDLRKAKSRQEIVEGLLIALKNIDEVVETIKKSSNTAEATQALIKEFALTLNQSKAVLDTRLSALTSMEVGKLNDEHKKLVEVITRLEEILGDVTEVLKIITKT